MAVHRLVLLITLAVASIAPSLRALDLEALDPHAASGAKGICTPNDTTLCLNQNRFRVTATWRTPAGQSGVGHVVELTNDTGYFWFFQSTNVEFLIKILNACTANNRYWVFAGGLTNVRVDITVEDTATGVRKSYHNPPSTPFQPIQDTNAFRTCGSAFAEDSEPEAVATESFLAALQQTAAPVTDLPPGLALRQGRFRVSAVWRKPSGEVGYGQPVQLTQETGYFWFFDPNNVEMMIKLLDGCPIGGRFWAFAAGLTNVAVEITVEDLATGVRKRYSNPPATPFAPIQDTTAFATCSDAGLPPDPGVAGQQTLAGVDSDHDGVRDDLQRNIALTYAGSQPTIRALRQMVKTLQSALVDSGSQSASLQHATQLSRDLECLAAMRPSDSGRVASELLAYALDTEARGRSYLAYNDRLGGEAFPLRDRTDWASSCQFAAAFNAEGQPVTQRASGEKAVCGQSDKKATVLYVNGVYTVREDAQFNLEVLEGGLAGALPAGRFEELQFLLAYNPTHGLVLDFFESVKQRLENDFSRFFRFLSFLDPMPDFMQSAYQAQALAIDVEALLTSPTALRHLQLYRNEILEGRKVILVSHSQGNLFANREYDSLPSDEQRYVGIVSVANPDSAVADGRPYTTLTKDLVIAVIPGALPANTSNGNGLNLSDPLGHGFVSSYLEAGTSRTRILGHVQSALNSVAQPEAEGGDGIITVTLTWGAQPDVDLHVFEPDGSHVYYSDRFGSVGYLDVDDVTSFGPEHYFAACEDLLAGTYRVGVNYYFGSGPETANVLVKAGLVLRSYQVRLNNAVGSAGNNSPIPVATIVVTGDSVDGFDFAVN